MSITHVIIPARYGSTRLPGKPLRRIAGKAMIERVWRIAKAAEHVDDVFVATDSEPIAEAVRQFGGKVIMTSEDCRTGTDRAHQAVQRLGAAPEIVINLQGDAPLTPPWVISQLAERMRRSDADVATPAVRLSGGDLSKFLEEKRTTPTSGTTVVVNHKGDALYFSKAVIPYPRSEQGEALRHVGLYAYRRETLARLVALPEGPLERAEKLEQLRCLENGIRIQVVVVDYRGRSHASVDSLEDIERAEAIIAREGELVD